MIYPDLKEFLSLTQKGNLVPVYTEILGDLETPVSAYLKLSHQTPYAFLLESVEGEERIGRYSFLASRVELILKTKGNQAEIIRFSKNKPVIEKKKIETSPLECIREIMGRYQWVPLKGLPRFCGGMVGYLSYDVVRFFERLPEKTKDDLKLEDAILMLAKHLVIFDHFNRTIKIVQCVEIPQGASSEQKKRLYQQALAAIAETTKKLKKGLPSNPALRSSKKPLSPRSNFTPAAFKKIVERAKEDIHNGEIIQVVLSQRFEVPVQSTPFNIYRSLRSLNPSPYMYYLSLGDTKIIGSSPELLVRCEEGVVETRPIAGTRPRGQHLKEDLALEKELLADPKERAEHIMLVDLGRNDLGRVCERGSVRVSEFMQIERYSHVMHIVSNVEGKLRPDQDIYDVLQCAFPAGTVSGAPKIRAMEIIEALEKERRGPYAGCIGYFSFSGNLDTCITIRTIVIKNKTAYIQAGAGIVADSLAEKEYAETVNKARAQMMAIEKAHQEFQD